MQDLRANTITVVKVGPFVDATDGVTPETGITLGAADQAELMKHGSTSVVDISAATWAAVTGNDGWYNLTLTASHTDTEGQLEVMVQDSSVCLPVVVRFRVMSEAAYDSTYVAKDDGFMDVNIKTIGRADTSETAADNLEAAFDGTGYDVGGIDVSELNSIVDDLLDAGRLDALIDAIKNKTDSLTFTVAGNVDSNPQSWDDTLLSVSSPFDDVATAVALATVDGNVDAILIDTSTTIPAQISGLNDLSTADIDARLAAIGLDHLVSASVTGTDITDNSIVAKLVSSSATADWDDYANTTDSLQAIRDRGDSAWVTATGFATSAALATAQSDLDILTGSDGVTLATSQPNYAPNTVVPDAAGTAAGLHSTTDGLISALNDLDAAGVRSAVGLASANLDTQLGYITDYSAYGLTILSGAISNADNAAESYTKTLNSVAYTVTYAGLDASGNRTSSTLSKV